MLAAIDVARPLAKVPSGSSSMGPGGRRLELPSPSDPQDWRDRAAEMRELARMMTDPNAAVLLTDLATDYDKRAKQAALKASGKKPPSTVSRGSPAERGVAEPCRLSAQRPLNKVRCKDGTDNYQYGGLDYQELC
jgi:hypothetical protein